MAGGGDIDIGESRLNYLLKASVVATAGGQGAKAKVEETKQKAQEKLKDKLKGLFGR